MSRSLLQLVVIGICYMPVAIGEDFAWTEWRNSLSPSGKPAAELTLANDGQSKYTILINAKASSQELKAAKELQYWIREISNATLPIESETADGIGTECFISIGSTSALQSAELTESKIDLADEGYGIEVEGNRLYLWGGKTRGVINAVLALLEEDLGCRWYSDEHNRIPISTTLTCRVVPRTFTPRLRNRDPLWYVARNSDWSLRNRTNAPWAEVPEEWGGRIDYDGMWVHTFHQLLPPDEYFEEHPEYFELDANGNRNTHQLCTTNPEVVKLIQQKVREVVRKNPHTEILSVSKNDGQGHWCHFEKCSLLDQKEESHMASILYLVNAVAEDIEKVNPNVTISTLAYGETIPVPKTMRPRKNVCIRLCSDDVGAWVRPFAPARDCEFARILKEWSAAHDRIYIWDYVTNYSHYLAPMPNFDVMADNVRFFVDNKAEGVMLQANFQSSGSEREWMRCWVTSKLLWDPTRDVHELMQDFVWGHYGKAAPPIARYNSLLRQQGIDYKKELSGEGLKALGYDGIRYGMNHPFLTRKFLEESTSLFDEAERLADSPELFERVEHARLPIMYVKLMRGPEFVGEDYGDILARFEKVARRIGITHLREGTPDLDEKIAEWKRLHAASQKASN